MNDSSGSSVSSTGLSPQKMLDSRASSFMHNGAGPLGTLAGGLDQAPSSVYQGNFNTTSGEAVATANKYSTSGVDVLGILSRAITRPNPSIALGPVDLSCSFAISDARHPEQPLIYASETFCHLTVIRSTRSSAKTAASSRPPAPRSRRAPNVSTRTTAPSSTSKGI